MAQTRTFKIGTIYSRVRRLLEKNVMKKDNKPLWYDIYEAFPPKYEPRYDRHLLPYGLGSNVKNMPPPKKILYEEDKIRAKYYKAFMSKDKKLGRTVANSEVIDLMDTSKQPFSQTFIEKYNKLKAEEQVPEDELFLEAVNALEFDGIYLRQSQFQKDVKSQYNKFELDDEYRPSQDGLRQSRQDHRFKRPDINMEEITDRIFESIDEDSSKKS